MSENVENLVLEHLHLIRSEVSDIKDILRDHGRRLTSIEISMGNMAATKMTHYANVALRGDKTDERLDRIEQNQKSGTRFFEKFCD